MKSLPGKVSAISTFVLVVGKTINQSKCTISLNLLRERVENNEPS